MAKHTTKDTSLTRPPGPKKPGRKPQYSTPEERTQARRNHAKARYWKVRNAQAGTAGTSPPDNSGFPTNDQMLEAMREVYKKMGGSKSLLKHMQGHSRDYMTMVQNLMRIEASQEEARIKRGKDDESQGIYVVMKGLVEGVKTCPHCGRDVTDPAGTVKEVVVPEQVIDLASMDGILNPGAEQVIKEGGDW